MTSHRLVNAVRPWLILVPAAMIPLSALADSWVTADDVAREAEEAEFLAIPAPPRAKARSMPVIDPDLPQIEVVRPNPLNMPQIEVVRPNPLNNIKAPFGVELHFAARPGSAIDPDSLKVSYGFMGIDLTDRIRRSATVTPAGLKAENVEIPRGDHRLTVRIADVRGRIGEKEIRIRVGE